MNLKYIKWKIKKRICKPKGTERGLYLVGLVKKLNLQVETVAEIGVWKGHTSIVLLEYIPSIKTYHLIDPGKAMRIMRKAETEKQEPIFPLQESFVKTDLKTMQINSFGIRLFPQMLPKR